MKVKGKSPKKLYFAYGKSSEVFDENAAKEFVPIFGLFKFC